MCILIILIMCNKCQYNNINNNININIIIIIIII